MRAAWLVALAACGSDAPCEGVASTCVIVQVSSDGIATIDTLELDISYAGFHAMATTTAGATSLPLATAVELDGATDPITVDIVAAGKLAGAVLGTGYQRTDVLAPGAHATLPIPIAAIADPCLRGTYCGGGTDRRVDGDPDTLYLCHPGGVDDPDGTPEADVPTARGRCANGCIRNTQDDDVCSGGNVPCTTGHAYCGGHELDGDPLTLYRCDTTATKPPVVQDCAAAGKVCGPMTANADSCQ